MRVLSLSTVEDLERELGKLHGTLPAWALLYGVQGSPFADITSALRRRYANLPVFGTTSFQGVFTQRGFTRGMTLLVAEREDQVTPAVVLEVTGADHARKRAARGRMLEIEPSQGVVVTRVQNDSPSASAGLKPGDVITAVNGKLVATEQELHNAEGLLPVGSAIQLKLLRDGKPIEASVRTATEQLATSSGATLDPRLDGAEFADLGERQHSAGLSGISITRIAPGSRAAASGLKNGDIVFAVNQVEIGSVRDLERLGTKRVRQLLLSVVRGNNSFLVPLQ